MSNASSQKLPFIIIGLLVIAAMGLGIRWYSYGRFHETTDNAYIRADTTFITPRVGGEIVQLLVKNNQAVNRRVTAKNWRCRLSSESSKC